MNKQISATVLGEGAFGTAIASLLVDCGVQVTLWCHDPLVAQQIAQTRTNKYIPNIVIPEAIIPSTSLRVVQDSDIVFVSTPVIFVREMLQQALPYYKPSQLWIMVNKGIEQDTLMLPTQIVDDVFGQDCRKAVLMGPSFARELLTKQPTQVVVAAQEHEDAEYIQERIKTSYFNTVISDDMLGVQVCGAYKNVLALGAGMLLGSEYAENTRALLLTKGVHEMALLVETIGGSAATVASLAGIGDLLLTACSMQSRNSLIGKRVGEGESLEKILAGHVVTPEGVTTANALSMLHGEDVPLPLAVAINAALHGKISVARLVDIVMQL